MKALLLTTLLAATLPALADTQYYYQNIPGTNLAAGSKPGFAVERTYGTTTIYQTLPGTTMRDATAPSYSTYNRPDPTDLDMSKSIERLGRGEE